MNRILLYIIVFLLLIILVNNLKKNYKEKYENEKDRPPGPWGNIGTAKPWYSYPYILHNIEYY
jgi:hypothetical protein